VYFFCLSRSFPSSSSSSSSSFASLRLLLPPLSLSLSRSPSPSPFFDWLSFRRVVLLVSCPTFSPSSFSHLSFARASPPPPPLFPPPPPSVSHFILSLLTSISLPPPPSPAFHLLLSSQHAQQLHFPRPVLFSSRRGTGSPPSARRVRPRNPHASALVRCRGDNRKLGRVHRVFVHSRGEFKKKREREKEKEKEKEKEEERTMLLVFLFVHLFSPLNYHWRSPVPLLFSSSILFGKSEPSSTKWPQSTQATLSFSRRIRTTSRGRSLDSSLRFNSSR